MSYPTADDIKKALSALVDPATITGISIKDGQVTFAIEVDPAKGASLEPLRQQAQAVVEKLAGVVSVRAVLTAERASPPMVGAAKKSGPAFSHKISGNPVAPRVRHLIAVASGKGGVGKSTVAKNLALSFAALGRKTGLLDADIYGASQPRMMGLHQKPSTNDAGLILPLDANGIKVMSMGFFVEPDAPVIWRGPMVHSAIQQLLRDVDWGDLDVLVIDLPPGTGDAQLSLAQYVDLSGAVIVSTPQAVALSEARKAVRMFEKTGVRVLGMVENMSHHECENCGHRSHIFDHGGARKSAADMNIDFLAEIPLNAAIRAAADAGQPMDGAIAETFKNIAARVLAMLPENSRVKKQAS